MNTEERGRWGWLILVCVGVCIVCGTLEVPMVDYASKDTIWMIRMPKPAGRAPVHTTPRVRLLQ